MRRGQHMAKQLDCITSIARTQNNGIQGINFGLHTTFRRLSRLANIRKHVLINISVVDWTTTKLDHSNQQMPYESCSLNWISGSAMIVGLKMTHISSEHYSTGIFSNVTSSFWHIDPFRAHLDFDSVRLTVTEGRRMYSEMKTGDWWWDTQDQLPAGATIVPVICASDKTHLTKSLGDQHAWQLYLTIGNSQKDSRCTPKKRAWILVKLIPCPLKGAKKFDDAWHSAGGTVLSQLRHLDITGPGLKSDCSDGFQRQCWHLLAAWVKDYPEQVMIAQVPYRSCPMCEIPKGVPMGHSTFRPLDNSRDQHIYVELLKDSHIDALHTRGVHPIRNQFWQYPLRNVYQLWQPDELHLLLLGLVKDLLNWLLKYLKARNEKDQFDNQFTSVPQYPGLQNFSKPFDSLNSSTWQGKEICGMIRTLALNCAPNLVCTTDDRKTAVETASDEMVMGAVRALCEFSLHVSQQNHSDLSLTHWTILSSNFTRRRVYFANRKWGSLRRPKLMTCWKEIPSVTWTKDS